MTSLTLLDYGSIRVTEDNRFSVFDTIKIIGGKKNPREYWKRLAVGYPEVVTFCDNFQFSGARQRLTPVADTKNIFYIIGLLPGAVGKAYREDAAREMCKKYGINYESLVATESKAIEMLPDVNAATLDLSIAIAQGISDSQKFVATRFNDIDNTVRRSAFDIKSEVINEIRIASHSISEDIKELAKSRLDNSKQTRNRIDRAITFHCENDEEYNELIALAEKSGMSRSQFFREIVKIALEPKHGS